STSEIEPKIQKNVPNHGPTTSLSTSPSPRMKSKSASSEMCLPYTVEEASTLKTTIEAMQMPQKETSCSLLATLNQPWKRRMFSSSWRTIEPVDGSGSGSPVSGDSTFGMYAPIPKPFSRIQLDWT